MELHYFLVVYSRGKNYDNEYKLVKATDELEAGYKFESWLKEKAKDREVGFTYESDRVIWNVLETLT